jgi:hypothetical protein
MESWQEATKYCRFPNKPVSLASVQKIESQLEIVLPEDYRSYLMEFNCGTFRKLDFAVASPENSTDRLQSLFGIEEGIVGDEYLGDEGDLELFDDNWPLRILPIGLTELSYMLLMRFEAGEFQEILMKRPYDSDGFTHLVGSFDEILTKLYAPT